MAVVIEPSLCETQELAVDVDAQGWTRVARGQSPNARVALHTDPQEIVRFDLSRVAL